jgi:hypothetical protein
LATPLAASASMMIVPPRFASRDAAPSSAIKTVSRM